MTLQDFLEIAKDKKKQVWAFRNDLGSFLSWDGPVSKAYVHFVPSEWAYKTLISGSACEFCKNTGFHLSPDVVEPIMIPCSKKTCKLGELAGKAQLLANSLDGINSYMNGFSCSENCDPDVGFHYPECHITKDFSRVLNLWNQFKRSKW